jgi:hypothetical protein
LQEVLFENVDNFAPFHFVDVFDGNDVPVNGVLLNVGHDVFVVRKDFFDGALIQELLDGPSFFGLVSHVIVVDIVFTQTSFGFYWFCCSSLKLSHEDL